MRRNAFTIVEMLIVLAIIAVIGGLLAMTLPGFVDRSRAARGASSMQGWLNYARQRAQLEEKPVGVRFHVENLDPTDPATPYVVRRCEYIAKPDDWNHGTPLVPSTPPDASFVKVAQRDASDNVLHEGQVAPFDYLELSGVGQVYVISGVAPSDATKPNVIDKIMLGSTLPEPLSSPIANYKVMRAPRPTGDEPVAMPERVFVDMSMFTKYAAAAKNHDAAQPRIVFAGTMPKYFDILFAPSGRVLDATGSRTILWIRMEARNATEFDRNPTLLSITTNTGAVGAFEPATVADPFANVK